MLDLLASLEEVFRDVLGDDQLVLAREVTAEDIEAWDSIAHVHLLVAVEGTFGVKFTTGEMARLTQEGQTVGNLVDLVGSKLA